jgi:hypothetical protein
MGHSSRAYPCGGAVCCKAAPLFPQAVLDAGSASRDRLRTGGTVAHMSLTKEMFMDMQERICEDYASDLLEYPDALDLLIRMGFDPHEANDLLTEAKA